MAAKNANKIIQRLPRANGCRLHCKNLNRWSYLGPIFVKTTWHTVKLCCVQSFSWSFGVCLWEIFTLGGAPYPGLPTEQLLDFLSEGHRMEQPHKCPLDMYTIMRDCWEQNPDIRPTFAQLSERIGRIIELHASKVMIGRDTEQQAKH